MTKSGRHEHPAVTLACQGCCHHLEASPELAEDSVVVFPVKPEIGPQAQVQLGKSSTTQFQGLNPEFLS